MRHLVFSFALAASLAAAGCSFNVQRPQSFTDSAAQTDETSDVAAPDLPGCTTDEGCIATGGEPGECKVWACVEGTCQQLPAEANSPCDDGDLCTVDSLCDDSGNCLGGVPKNCPDSDPHDCTDYQCNPENGDCEAVAIPECGECVPIGTHWPGGADVDCCVGQPIPYCEPEGEWMCGPEESPCPPPCECDLENPQEWVCAHPFDEACGPGENICNAIEVCGSCILEEGYCVGADEVMDDHLCPGGGMAKVGLTGCPEAMTCCIYVDEPENCEQEPGNFCMPADEDAPVEACPPGSTPVEWFNCGPGEVCCSEMDNSCVTDSDCDEGEACIDYVCQQFGMECFAEICDNDQDDDCDGTIDELVCGSENCHGDVPPMFDKVPLFQVSMDPWLYDGQAVAVAGRVGAGMQLGCSGAGTDSECEWQLQLEEQFQMESPPLAVGPSPLHPDVACYTLTPLGLDPECTPLVNGKFYLVWGVITKFENSDGMFGLALDGWCKP